MKKIYSLLFLLLLSSSVRSFAAQVTTDYDHSANFSEYKTYSWIKVQAGDSLWADRIQQDVDVQLAARGRTKVAANGNASISALNLRKTKPPWIHSMTDSAVAGGGEVPGV